MTIKEARETAGLSRKEMAEVFKIPYRTLQNWELGSRECPEWAEMLIIEKLQRMEENKMKFYTADRETGTFIDEVKTIEEGLELIKQYEEDDKEEGAYQEDFYDIVDENHCHIDRIPSRYVVFWVGGKDDGKVLFESNDDAEARGRAYELQEELQDKAEEDWWGICLIDKETDESLSF